MRGSHISTSSDHSWVFQSPDETRAWGRRLARGLTARDVIALVGGLGAGKTTLVQGIATGWGRGLTASSPTFALAHEYRSRRGRLIHMDMYRLSARERDAFPLEDYFGEGPCVIEWADRVRRRLPRETLTLTLTSLKDETRRVRAHRPSPAWRKRLRGLR